MVTRSCSEQKNINVVYSGSDNAMKSVKERGTDVMVEC